MIAKAAASVADQVVIDLEDAVAPSGKVAARANVVAALNDLDWGAMTRSVRINGVDTMWCHDDVIDVVSAAGSNLDVLVIPKVLGGRDVWFVDDLLTQLEMKLGLDVGRIGLEALIEDVRALTNITEIAAASPRLEALVLGVGDLAASQRMRGGHIGATDVGYPGDVWHFARSQLIVAARTVDIDAIDGPVADIRDVERFETSARTFAILGGTGKWCVHPAQLEPANRMFAPSAEEVAEARRVLDALDAAEARGDGVSIVDGKMIDAATARGFRRILEAGRGEPTVPSGA
jgi:citrate lyase subunit beta / citryl-CoA lyase